MTRAQITRPDLLPSDDLSAAWTPSRRRFLSLTGMALGGSALGLGAVGCGTAQTGNDKVGGAAQGRPGESGNTLFLYVSGSGPASNFNPVGPSASWPCGPGHGQLIYETLVRFNLLDGSLLPGLATELQAPDKTKFVLPLQEGTMWSDGTELTAADVVFTFNLAKDNALSYSDIWSYVDSVTATDARTVEFALKESPYNPLPVRSAIASTYIIPEHIWKTFGSDLASQKNTKPVGSGPFLLDKYDQTQIVITRHDDYWGKAIFGVPAMTKINHPTFKTNNDADLKLESGELDASQGFTTQIWKMWEDKKAPVGTWLKEKPYYLPGNIPWLMINTAVKGLDDVNVRRALAYAVDTPSIARLAMSDYSDPAKASIMLPTGSESAFFDQAGVDSDGWTFDAAKAVQILENDAKATKGADGIYVLPDGTRLGPWKAITPTGWSDWNTALEIVAKNAKAVGIDISTDFPQAPLVTSKLQNGDFELACWSAAGVSPASPWSRFRDLMDDRGVAPIGKTAFSNFARFSHPDVPDLLDRAGQAGTDEERKAAYGELDKIYRAAIPAIPLMYRPLEFYEFNSSTWTNFPDENNPYAPPMFQGAGIGWVFKLKRTGT